MKSGAGSEAKRPYRMTARAEAAAATGRRILQAVVELHTERFHDQVTLEDVADRAGVTAQTVLRRFGSKEQLLTAAAEQVQADVRRQRWQAPVGDVSAAVENLLDHYEEQGRGVLRLLAQEERVPQFHTIIQQGRQGHREWVQHVFGPFLHAASQPAVLETQLVALTDVYVWKLLRLDTGLDRGQTRAALLGMIHAVLDAKERT
jgi:AcrR family transcriptional regulator